MISPFFVSVLLGSAPPQIDWNHPYGNPVQLVDGGLCTGIAWIKLLPGEIATVDYGPDFNVYRVQGQGNAGWGAYSGFAAQVSADTAYPLVKKDGVTVYRATGAEFSGYFVEEKTKEFSSQNHFFGTVLKDDPSDAAFFARVTFGPAADAKCDSGNQ